VTGARQIRLYPCHSVATGNEILVADLQPPTEMVRPKFGFCLDLAVLASLHRGLATTLVSARGLAGGVV